MIFQEKYGESFTVVLTIWQLKLQIIFEKNVKNCQKLSNCHYTYVVTVLSDGNEICQQSRTACSI